MWRWSRGGGDFRLSVEKKTKLKMFQWGSGSGSSHSGFLPRAKANAESVNIKKKKKSFSMRPFVVSQRALKSVFTCCSMVFAVNA